MAQREYLETERWNECVVLSQKVQCWIWSLQESRCTINSRTPWKINLLTLARRLITSVHLGFSSDSCSTGLAALGALRQTKVTLWQGFVCLVKSELPILSVEWTGVGKKAFLGGGHTHGIWKFPGLGSNQSYSCRSTSQPQQRKIRASSVTYTTSHGNTGPLAHWARPGIEPITSWFLVGFVSAAPRPELEKGLLLLSIFYIPSLRCNGDPKGSILRLWPLTLQDRTLFWLIRL